MTTAHEIEVYVRFSETDAAGHVNNTSHFLYLEEARTRFFTEIGFGADNNESFLSFILASTTCNYIAQAYATQTLKVFTNIAKIGTKSFTVRHTIIIADTGIAVAEASATMVYYNYVKQRSEAIPTSLRNNLKSNLADPVI